jgi:hypothetical protein
MDIRGGSTNWESEGTCANYLTMCLPQRGNLRHKQSVVIDVERVHEHKSADCARNRWPMAVSHEGEIQCLVDH